MDLPHDAATALTTLKEHVYGDLPAMGEPLVRIVGEDISEDGFLTRKLKVSADGISAILALPSNGSAPHPTFVALSFESVDSLKTPKWPLRQITSAGFGVAVSWYQDWYPDEAESMREGPRAISTWAAALSALRLAVAAQPEVDGNRLIALGHSRLGKAALWAVANDPAFAACVAIQSGCGGAAPNRIQAGEEDAERISNITSMFPHWFADSYAGWANRESEMPFDQHWLLAAIAPRPVLLLNAEEDRWANPAGQDRMAAAVRPAYPSPDLLQTHTRPGKHEVLLEDWQRAMEFASILG